MKLDSISTSLLAPTAKLESLLPSPENPQHLPLIPILSTRRIPFNKITGTLEVPLPSAVRTLFHSLHSMRVPEDLAARGGLLTADLLGPLAPAEKILQISQKNLEGKSKRISLWV